MEEKIKLERLGLTSAEAAQRVERSQVNTGPESSSRSLAAILRANILTLFNAILGVLLVLILIFGELRDALFGIVLFSNMFIGIVQELRAKLTLDRLSVLSATAVRVYRDAELVELDPAGVVLDDVLELQRGEQVVADGEVLESRGLEVDESLLTGESEPVEKRAGDQLLSGSFAVAGSGVYRADRVGEEAYARRLTAQARRFKLVYSELRSGINQILKVVVWFMIPVGALLFWRQLSIFSFQESISGMVAAMVGMVPEGLVLLTSISFALAVVVLGRRKVLVQELPAVEGLARVDVVCFDKTGTLTEAGLHCRGVESTAVGVEAAEAAVPGQTDIPEGISTALAVLASDPSSSNSTTEAIAERFPPPAGHEEDVVWRVPFSSERKWSAMSRSGRDWFLGAPEVLFDVVSGEAGPESGHTTRERAANLAAEGFRVLLLASRAGREAGSIEPGGLAPEALVVLEEKIRSDAAPTLEYFERQGVEIKVISGDNVATVAAVAARAGVAVKGEPRDGRELSDDPGELAPVMEANNIFGRVGARQKQAMVEALQAGGHVVAMTGDGVNDTLAVKEADIGVAVGKGAAAPTKAVAELVLIDGRFATLPGIVAEGRRIIANIERVAYLFVTKTCYATLLALIISILGWQYPFIPRHLTLVGAITIGIPAFFLALGPSKQRYRPGFLRRVVQFTVPAGTLLALGTMASYILTRNAGADLQQSRTVATIVLTAMGLGVLVVLSQPLTLWRVGIIFAMVGCLLVASVTPLVHQFLDFEFPPGTVFVESLGVAALCIVILSLGMKVTGWTPGESEEPPGA